jgi:hypothetical protein
VSQDDRMSHIGHWLIEHPMMGGRTIAVFNAEHADDYRRREDYRVTGPFVPDSQLREAVDLLREVGREEVGFEDPPGRGRVVLRIDRATYYRIIRFLEGSNP